MVFVSHTFDERISDPGYLNLERQSSALGEGFSTYLKPCLMCKETWEREK